MDIKEKYQVAEEIYLGQRAIVYSGTSLEDGRPVIIKALRRESLTAENIGAFRKEFELTRSFENSPGIVQALGLESLESTLDIVLEDFGAKSLRELLQETSLSLEQTLQIGISVATALEEIHGKQLMHKDINPNNIVYNAATGTAKIIDFGIASRVSRENPSLEINKLLGTLPYISPEQTGRMNRLVDYRTDLYSFGATLYELLVGHPPFYGDDPLEIVHGHIAKPPRRLNEIDSEIPTPLVDLVDKLLKKNAEERYQSATGVKEDLKICLQHYTGLGRIEPFPLGEKDVSSRLNLGQRLYGRSRETEQLLLGFEQVLAGASQLFLISGTSGVGKTALVNEVYKPMTENRGYFVSSKFDQFDRNTPYMAIVDAFNQLARQLLAEDDEQIRQWRRVLCDSLGENGGIITETIPDMGLIMGAQAPVDTLPPLETKNRFNVVFQKFLNTLATVEHPVVLFLDDLQWADIASLELIEQLVNSPRQRALYIVGAYRNNEVDDNHPLCQLTGQLRSSELAITEVSLGPLSPQDISALISDTLRLPENEVEELAEHVFSKTYGNPFFVGQLLESFDTEGLLFFDLEAMKWRWKLAKIREYGFSDNVIDLLVSKIEKLSPACREMLRQAACVGTVFERELLSDLGEREDEDSNSFGPACEEAITAGLVQQVAPKTNVFAEGRTSGVGTKSEHYEFVHDRVLQAVYTNIPREKRLKTHAQVGRILLDKCNAAQEVEDLHLF